jgi:cytochrome b561
VTERAEPALDAATRIAAGDDKTRYDNFSIALHWTTALLVLAQFVTSQIWDWFARPTHHLIVVAHMTMGVLLTVVIVARLIWRLTPGHRLAPIATGWMEAASRAGHWLLYLLLLSEAVLGWLTRWSEGRAMSFFGLLIQPLIGPMSRDAHHTLMERHEQVGWVIVIVALLHALAALYHHYSVRDRVLVRMAPWLRNPASRIR